MARIVYDCYEAWFSEGATPFTHYSHTFDVQPLQSQREDNDPLYRRLRSISKVCVLCSHGHLFPGGWILGIHTHSRPKCSPLTPGAPRMIMSEDDDSTSRYSPGSRRVHADNTSVHVNSSFSLAGPSVLLFLVRTAAGGEDLRL